jgi:hypothetical protein
MAVARIWVEDPELMAMRSPRPLRYEERVLNVRPNLGSEPLGAGGTDDRSA